MKLLKNCLYLLSPLFLLIAFVAVMTAVFYGIALVMDA
jgi:hypothetical protein